MELPVMVDQSEYQYQNRGDSIQSQREPSAWSTENHN